MAMVGKASTGTWLPTTLMVWPAESFRKSACRQRWLPPSINAQRYTATLPSPRGRAGEGEVGESGRLRGFLNSHRLWLEGLLEHLAHVADQVNGHRLPNAGRQIVQVALVAVRQDDLGEPGAVRRQQLLLDAADRQYGALQGDLAGHAHGAPHRTSGHEAHQRGHHGHARRG